MNNPGIFNELFSNLWSIFLVVVFFGGSIFIHELGHFLAARKRGLKVERFSIGFGPKLFGWTKNGVDYRVSLLPLGGYVALPQLADLEAIEGEYKGKDALPPISYADKVIVAVMGAVFNIFFALFLATILWYVGMPSTEAEQTTVVGYTQPEILVNVDTEAPGPAYTAGIRPGDRVLTVDGEPVSRFSDIQKVIVTGTGRSESGKPEAIFTVERAGETLTFTVYPRLALANLKSGDEMRVVGIIPAQSIIVGNVMPGSPAEAAGLKLGDRIIAAAGEKLYSMNMLSDITSKYAGKPLELTVDRGIETLSLEATPEAIAFTKPLAALTQSSATLTFLSRPIQADKQNASSPTHELVVFETPKPGEVTPEAFQGLEPGDILTEVNEEAVSTPEMFMAAMAQSAGRSAHLMLQLEQNYTENERTVLPPYEASIQAPETRTMLGFSSRPQNIITHPTPWYQFSDSIRMTFRVLGSLFSSNSDIKVNNLMGPPGIVRVLHTFSSEDIRLVLWFTVLLNINLAILNLLPIPVLDGGQIVFATIAKLRNKPLAPKLIGSIQGTFMILLFSLMIYVSFFDIRRWQGDNLFEKRIELQQFYYIKPEFSKNPTGNSE